jgi:hypothetical protein
MTFKTLVKSNDLFTVSSTFNVNCENQIDFDFSIRYCNMEIIRVTEEDFKNREIDEDAISIMLESMYLYGKVLA